MKRTQSFLVFAAVVCFFATSGFSCGGSDTTGSSSSSSSSTSGGDDCGMSLCGCWEDTTMTFDATVEDASTMMPLSGIELFCKGEDTAIAVSDAAGKLIFSIETKSSPGCGFERCTNMTLHDPNGAHMDVDGTYYTFNGKTLSM
ncbi:MAG: hypothetical protein IPM54_24470 [Polyangiaceae bacterium]|nr:hypothetical protein [Polyangiaceae bacterium]